jgi:hypothetical protein
LISPGRKSINLLHPNLLLLAELNLVLGMLGGCASLTCSQAQSLFIETHNPVFERKGAGSPVMVDISATVVPIITVASAAVIAITSGPDLSRVAIPG